MKQKVIYLGMAALLCISIVYSCSKGSSSTTTPVKTTPPAGGTTVAIQNFAFSPASVTVKAGTTVTWTNSDSAPHTVTDVNGAFDSGSIATNGSYKRTFSTAGTYTYHCTIHSMMANATVVVTN